MFARITNYKMKSDRLDEAMSLLGQLKPKIMAMPGMVQFINAHDATGAGYVISIVESEETSDANQEQVQALWAQFADYLEAPPVPSGFGVVADWTN